MREFTVNDREKKLIAMLDKLVAWIEIVSCETSPSKALAIQCQSLLLFHLEMLQDRSNTESNRTLRRNSTAYNQSVLASKYQSKETEKNPVKCRV